MLQGYTTQFEVFNIFIRFRTFRFVFTDDIHKIFIQIRINPDQNIVWPQKELKTKP